MLRKLFCLLLFFSVSFVVNAQQNTENYVEEDSTEVGIEEVKPPEDDETTYKVEDNTPEKLTLLKIDSSNYPIKNGINLSDTVNKIRKEADYWYVTAKFEEKEKEKKSNRSSWSFFDSALFDVIMWVLFAGIIITAIVFFLIENDIISFRRKAEAVAKEITQEKEENIFEIDFEKRIEEAIAANNYTLATRLLMLRMLKQLSLKQHITYSLQKTNLDYQIEMSSKSFSQQVNKCFYFYDNVSYGDFEISYSQFNYIKDYFNQTEKAF